MGDSFDAVFATELPALHAYFARRVGSSAAEELTGETFAVLYRRWEDRDPARPVRPWIYGIAANLLKHHWRRERRMLNAYARSATDPVLVEADVSLDRLEAQTARMALAASLAELRRQEREVLLLSAWAELSDAEIAEALKLPLGTVKSRLNRARQHLRNHLGLIGQVDDDNTPTTKEGR